MSAAVSCPALMIGATASGQGKTTITAAIARAHARRGQRVRVFKTGPDFIDPTILAAACGSPVHTLDLFMGGEAHCRALLHDAASTSDLVIVEGAMGLHDGTPSCADVAERFGLPVLAVVDAAGMAQTFAAIVHGLATYRKTTRVVGVIANRVAGAHHAAMLQEGLSGAVPLVAALCRDEMLALPERHLGLVPAAEHAGLEAILDRAADWWDGQGASRIEFAPVSFEAPPRAGGLALAATGSIVRPLAGLRIALADDAAFSFIYPANVDTLRSLGAQVERFSPLRDDRLPGCDALWLPGGYPELHAPALARNAAMLAAIRDHAARGRPIVAECGGMLYLLETLTDAQGATHRMAAVLPGHARMQARLAALGPQLVDLPEGELRGHTFHYSVVDTPLQPFARARHPQGRPAAEALLRQGRTTATYLHAYFPSNPAAVAAWFRPEAA